MSICCRCSRDRPARADGGALGYSGGLCAPCYQGEWRRQRRGLGPLESRLQRAINLSRQLQEELAKLEAALHAPKRPRRSGVTE